MARIIFSGIVQEIAGSINGSTFQRNQYGITMRNKPIPTKGTSVSQSTIRNTMNQITGSWSRLTLTQKQAFERFLTFSPDYTWNNASSLLSGYNLFLKWNFYYFRRFGTIASDIIYLPAIKSLVNPTVFDLTTEIDVYVNPNNMDANEYFSVSASPLLRSVNDNPGSNFRWMGDVQNEGSNLDILVAYQRAYGHTLVVGDIIGLSFVNWSWKCPIIFAPTFHVVQIQS